MDRIGVVEDLVDFAVPADRHDHTASLHRHAVEHLLIAVMRPQKAFAGGKQLQVGGIRRQFVFVAVGPEVVVGSLPAGGNRDPGLRRECQPGRAPPVGVEGARTEFFAGAGHIPGRD